MSNRYAAPPSRGANGYGNFGRSEEEYDPYGGDPRSNTRGERYGSPSRGLPPPRGDWAPNLGAGAGAGAGGGPPPVVRNMPSRPRITQSTSDRQITQVLEHIRAEWPSMCSDDCIPVQLALQLLDTSSVGRAHDYRKFQDAHTYLQDSLKNTVHEHHQGFNSSIGTFHKIQSSIQGSQRRVRALKESLASATSSLCSTDPELRKLSESSQAYDDLLQTLNELDELRAVPDQLEARISEKRFLTAVDVLQGALRKLRRPELDDIGALNDLRSYLVNQETALMDILVEELHEHLYLKSPYCQERWQSLYRTQGAFSDEFTDTNSVVPFHAILDSMDIEKAVTEDPMKNPEADTFYYIALLVEALNKLGRLQSAVETLKQRMPVELFAIANETNNEVDQRHPSSLRGGTTKSESINIYNSRETQMRAEVINDLLWSLYGKFEAIGEGHRVFHESIKALIRREGAGNNSALLGSFKELWNLYQNEIRSLLRNYVTTDADVFQFDSPNPGGSLQSKKDAAREHLFKFAEIDAKSIDISTEYEALEGIVQAAVPGLTGNDRKQGADRRRDRMTMDDAGSRRHTFGYSSESKPQGSHKPLVEPSVFNMSLLLPPTLLFLQRLRTIVPPGSDLATSTLTTFLDNFLVNVFQPQLDETLAKLCDSILAEMDSFAQDANWTQYSRLPIFKGTTAFFQIVTAFCKMLSTIPPDQALSSLLVTQMMRYYDRCFDWYKLLVTKTQEQTSDAKNLRASARFAVQPGEIHEVMKQMWLEEEGDRTLSEKEIHLLIEHTNESRLEPNDIIQDRETITSLCLVYTSMKWLATRISGLRHITSHETDSSRQSMARQASRRWTLMDESNKATATDSASVLLPLTADTVQTFDNIVSSYEELAGTALLTLHMEVRCRIVHSLRSTLSTEGAPYLLEQDVRGPDPQILSLNLELVLFDETVSRYLRAREAAFVRNGLGLLIGAYLVGNAAMASPINARGGARMRLNILVLQQNLKNIDRDAEDMEDLARAANYFALLDKGPDAVLAKAAEDRDKKMGEEAGATRASNTFTYEELRTLLELCMSEQAASSDRGLAAAAKRQLADKLQEFTEKA